VGGHTPRHQPEGVELVGGARTGSNNGGFLGTGDRILVCYIFKVHCHKETILHQFTPIRTLCHMTPRNDPRT